MELVKKIEKRDHEIIYSKAVKAGRRIYYLDVKRNRKNDLFLCITESKKIVCGYESENQQVRFEKHKIFLYKEDFERFAEEFSEIISFIKNESLDTRKQIPVIKKSVDIMEGELEKDPLEDSSSGPDNELFFQLALEEIDV